MRFLLPLMIICSAVVFAWWLVTSKQYNQALPSSVAGVQQGADGVLADGSLLQDPETLPVVRVRQFQPKNWDIPIQVAGVVKPVEQVSLVSEHEGQLRYIHPLVKQNGLIKRGEKVYQLSSPQVESRLIAAQSKLQQSLQQLSQTQAQMSAAGEVPGLDTPVKYRQSVLGAQEALVSAARAEVQLARVMISRQTVTAPFDARVVDAGFSTGQTVPAGTELGQVFSPKTMLVDIGLTPANARLLRQSASSNITDGQSKLNEIQVVVARAFGGTHEFFPGRLLSTRGTIDPTAGTENLQLEVADASDKSLMPGERVDVRLLIKLSEVTLRVPHGYVQQQQVYGIKTLVRKRQQLPIGEVLRYSFEPIIQDQQHVYFKWSPSQTKSRNGLYLIQSPPNWLLPGHQVRMNRAEQFTGERSLRPAELGV